MVAQIVKEVVLDIIERKIEILKERGVFVVDYAELLLRLNRIGYTEDEVRAAIIELVKAKELKTGKYADGKGWLRDFRNMDRTE